MRLVMEHLSKQFKNRIAVESIDTELREGVYGFLGANGAGKTTLMQMICGIIEPTAGEVKINGEKVEDMKANAPKGTNVYQVGKRKFARVTIA